MKQDFYMGPYSNTYKTCWDVYSKVLEKIKFSRDEKILDAGCGEGKFGNFLRGFNLYGIDFHKDSVIKSRKSGNYVKVVKGNLYKMPFKNKEFDKTVSIQVFQYLKNPDWAFKEIKRVTKKVVIITAANYKWFKIKNIFSKKFEEDYRRITDYENHVDADFFKRMAKKNRVSLKIRYVSNRFGLIRDLFGNHLSSEVIGIFYLN